MHFRCDNCDMQAVSMKHLKVHKMSAHPEHQCNSCGMSFQDEIRCNVHILKEHPFQCDACGVKYTQKSNLESHVKTKHPKEMKCIVCSFNARDENEITRHYEEVHLKTEETEKEVSSSEIEACRNNPSCHYLKTKKMQLLP